MYYIAETQHGRPTQNQWVALRPGVVTLLGAWVGKKNKEGKVVPVARRNPSGQVLAGWEAL